MESTGILRKLDELGRVVVPKSIKKRLNLSTGDMLEVFMMPDGVAFKKYLPIEDNTLIEKCCEELSKITGHPCFVASQSGGAVSCSKEGALRSIKNQSLVAGVMKFGKTYNGLCVDQNGWITIVPLRASNGEKKIEGVLAAFHGKNVDPAIYKLLDYSAAIISAQIQSKGELTP